MNANHHLAHAGRIHVIFTACLTIMFGLSMLPASPEATIDEYQVKAAFLYNFAKFIQWPDDAFQGTGDALSFCLLGSNSFGRSLDTTVAGKSIDGRPLAVRRITSAKEAIHCHVLFINSTDYAVSLPPEFRSRGILTVGDSGPFRAYGAVINFKLEGGKVRFEIDLDAAEREHLRISSRLLSLAHVIQKGK